ncbi:HpcH/HpaI aldolase/citrate lyase family protein [Paenibacillus sp. FSL H8-0034]|uniref:HpcH/HpaI aldolase/citrate lyase family protein n=1 Tax=Paenibacillus sp. FSL H8-0034 TaxID=2954671 RepID=UPI0030F5A5D8
MRYFNYLSEEEEQLLFYEPPVSFDNTSDKELLSIAVGAALYTPATRLTIADDIVSGKHEGLTSLVLDLEDAVGDHQVELAEECLIQQLRRLSAWIRLGTLLTHSLPLLFIRVRSPEQMGKILTMLQEDAALLTGFVFPKFTVDNAHHYLQLLMDYNQHKAPSAAVLYGMPILETAAVIYRESRLETLLAIKQLLEPFKAYILNIRIGATDFSSLFGIRRSSDMTIYDLGVIRDCIMDIINVFGRIEDGYVISGPVWEYFKSDRSLKQSVQQNLFEDAMGRKGRRVKMQVVNRQTDGLLREIALDKENGLIGKTIIHPTHITLVQSLLVVSHEEYMDATSIIANNNGYLGVMKSQYANKMNEMKPHLNWAQRIMNRSKVYGVFHENQNFNSLLVRIGQEQAYVQN